MENSDKIDAKNTINSNASVLMAFNGGEDISLLDNSQPIWHKLTDRPIIHFDSTGLNWSQLPSTNPHIVYKGSSGDHQHREALMSTPCYTSNAWSGE